MTIKRLDHVSVVVDDLAAAIAFFTALGMTLEGQMPVEGPWVDRVNGLEVSKSHRYDADPRWARRLELTKFRNPKLVEIERRSHRRTRWASGASCLQSKASTTLSLACAPNGGRTHRRGGPVRGHVQTLLHARPLRASSSRWPRNSSEAFTAAEKPVRLGAPSTRSHGSQHPAFLAYLRRGLVRAT